MKSLDGFPNWIAVPLGFAILAIIVLVTLLDSMFRKLHHMKVNRKASTRPGK